MFFCFFWTDNFCSLDTGDYRDLADVGVAYIVDGETMELSCKDEWKFKNYAIFQCIDLQPRLSRCKYCFNLLLLYKETEHVNHCSNFSNGTCSQNKY